MIDLAVNRDQVQIESTKLVSGERVLRVTEPTTGFVLEKKLDGKLPVILQMGQLLRMFEAALGALRKCRLERCEEDRSRVAEALGAGR